MVTKQNIKDAAFKLFAKNGYAETSMEDIANNLSLKKQSLYSHFSRKSEIFCDILNDQKILMIGEIGGKLREFEDETAETLLLNIAKSYIDLFSNRDRLLLWKRINLMTGNDEYSEMLSGLMQYDKALSMELYKTIKKNYPWLNENEFHYLFLSYMILIFGYLEWMLLNSHSEVMFNVIWRNFWDGVKKQLRFD